jgi:hypothetical protein
VVTHYGDIRLDGGLRIEHEDFTVLSPSFLLHSSSVTSACFLSTSSEIKPSLIRNILTQIPVSFCASLQCKRVPWHAIVELASAAHFPTSNPLVKSATRARDIPADGQLP